MTDLDDFIRMKARSPYRDDAEVARLMQEERPDLSFVLTNISPAQLALCPSQFWRAAADMHCAPFADGTFGAAMFCYSLGHALLQAAIAEAARLLRPGGILFIYDLEADDSAALIDALAYKAHDKESVERSAAASGFRPSLSYSPPASPKSFFDVMDEEGFGRLFAGVRPFVYRLVKA